VRLTTDPPLLGRLTLARAGSLTPCGAFGELAALNALQRLEHVRPVALQIQELGFLHVRITL
jgi:hypothetical protein